MKTLAVRIALCSTCGRMLNPKGECMSCLVRLGFDEPLPELSSAVFGDFEIVRREDGFFWELGRGAMGVTYRAEDKVLNRSVALKVIDAPATEGGGRAVRDRFLREARAAAAFRHPNVAGVFHFGASSEGDRCYYAMELIEGETLEALVRRDGPLEVKAALEMTVQVTRALIAAAGYGLIHRDLKPGNIMLTPSEEESSACVPLASGKSVTGTDALRRFTVKVIDFGLAKAIADNGNETQLTKGGFIGTPAFASPEQFSGAAADARSDIYSLGVTLWYALTGEVPYQGKTIEEIRHCQSDLPLPVQNLIARKIPTPVIQLLRRILAVDPTQRPASAREFMGSLESCRSRLGLIPAKRSKALQMGGRLLVLAAAVVIALAFFVFRLSQQKVATANAANTTKVAAAPVLIPKKSIAVLPFENLSAEKENAFFADGVQDDILTALSKIADLKVISRTSVVSYRAGAARNLRAIAQELGVANILEGSVRRAGGKVRVTTQLINAQTDAHLWADTYDRSLEDVFAIQSEIALQVATQLQAKLSPSVKSAIEERPTHDSMAYEFYIRAKLLREKPATDSTDQFEAIALLDMAVKRDPQFHLAYCTLASLHTMLYANWEHVQARRALAERALEAAVRLRPDAAETHLARADYYYRCDFDYDKARAELALAQRELSGEPRFFITAARMDRCQGRWQNEPRNWEKALELDPRNMSVHKQLYVSYRQLRRYPQAADTLKRAAAVNPVDPWPRVLAGELELHWRANIKPLHDIFDELAKENPEAAATWSYLWMDLALCERNPDAAERAAAAIEDGQTYDGVVVPDSWFDGLAARMRGDLTAAQQAFTTARAEAEKALADQPEEGPPLCALGLIDAALGRKDKAIQEGRRAAELFPITKNATTGGYIQGFLALIYVFCGEKDLAIEQLKTSVKLDETWSYGELRLHPFWDPLRGDPRFKKLVASLAPKPGE